jgi:hypothetical protein
MTARDVEVPQFRWIGRGIYTPAEASRLTGVSTGRVRRWLRGYAFGRDGDRRISPPVLSPEVTGANDGFVALTFNAN